MHQVSVLSPYLLTEMVDVVTEFSSEGALSELLHDDDIVLMSQMIKELRNKFLK